MTGAPVEGEETARSSMRSPALTSRATWADPRGGPAVPRAAAAPAGCTAGSDSRRASTAGRARPALTGPVGARPARRARRQVMCTMRLPLKAVMHVILG
ncbi:hypothetical protein GCM10010507_01630 [Streptomyces cinnamoneus]|uniref:Uncharacterized protein n=1 Tax=Streptomyces cinnamoneus TaxID=53446 RepID=A0A918WE78_STRCJ|nr:hypothetical protein GCM10010507_01630 [Streptomyces cinnamoneus]